MYSYRTFNNSIVKNILNITSLRLFAIEAGLNYFRIEFLIIFGTRTLQTEHLSNPVRLMPCKFETRVKTEFVIILWNNI